ncbi:CerR family C-terminal domain-containing protein [Desulfatirhabdium butyrativorans]|uniref:CerR family C-terminal domain-containing protein n=1 Tax=Desulfatirhabdium butyrativorans TaxID=340467 RepID=UPI00040E1A37|nr:CerR family C-terminal domain-containing protein [Desulfatirhabdium butyrativorans]
MAIKMSHAAKEKNTRDRLLESAAEVFARKGFRDATIAEICKNAGANVASANYYFGDKTRLYAEAWRISFEYLIAQYPADGGIDSGAGIEERMRGRILSVLHRISHPQSYAFDILHKEMANPTGLLDVVIRDSVEPIRKGFLNLLRELVGEEVPEKRIWLCLRSVLAQCFDLLVTMRRKPVCRDAQELEWTRDIDGLADHILRFSLAGIREVCRSK